MTLQIGLWRLITLAWLFAASCVGTVAQQAPLGDAGPVAGAVASQPPSWSVGCAATERSAALNCAVEQRVFVANGQMVGSISVRVPGDATGPVMMVTTPLGLFLPAGVTIAVDEDAVQTLEVQTCDARGCYVEWPVSGSLLDSMINGNKLNIGFQDLAKQPITLSLSLIGFASAYAMIK
ncbi:MAG: invasion associated locus B family protein [Cucumibacter sp.]